MATDTCINNGLPLQKHFIAVHACPHVSSESLERTKVTVLINTLTPYQIRKKHNFCEKTAPSWRESNVADTNKERDKCMHE